MSTEIEIRSIKPSDNTALESCIRTVLTEFGANRPGFAWQDPELSDLFTAYQNEDCQYWVATRGGELLGGCGIAPLEPAMKGVCELQKMYLFSNARGQGVGSALLETALSFAREYYRWCYLETLANMGKAEVLYRKMGFQQLPQPLIQTEHSGCDRWYLKEIVE